MNLNIAKFRIGSPARLRWRYLFEMWNVTGTVGLPKFLFSFLKLHRAFLTKRGRGLRELLPLETPLNVQIDPTNACNFRCSFCPTGDTELLKEVGRPRGLMDYRLFTKLIDDLGAFPRPIEELHLYKDGEPLLHRRIGEMITYARKKGVAKRIILTSNCALLDRDKAVALLESGLDVLRVSVEHVNNEGYRKITKKFGDYQTIIDNVRFLYQEKRKRRAPLHIHAKMVDVGFTIAEKRKFYSDFHAISDTAALETIMGWSNPLGRDFMLGLDPDAGISGVAPRKRDRKVCPSPFYMMSVNWNGQVSVCCVDWSMDTIVGDGSHQSLIEIWNGPLMNKFRLEHLKGNGAHIKACHDCKFVQGFLPSDDLDDCAAGLVPLYPDRLGGDVKRLSAALSSQRAWRVSLPPPARRSGS